MTERSGMAEQPTRDPAVEFIFNVTFEQLKESGHGIAAGRVEQTFRKFPPDGNGTVSLLATEPDSRCRS